jgi:iron(III) transport system substrate-binding protein
LCGAGLLALAAAGCWNAAGPEVVVYTALDREFSEPILDDFAAATGIAPLPKYDDESTKSVGLTSAIIAESDRPRCDVFWNNEILNTLRLEQKGLLEAYHPREAERFPPWSRSPDGAWHGFAARARVLIVNTDLVPEADRPKSIYDLADPRWKGRTGIARPVAGSTATHAACLFATLGADEVQVQSGNKQVATAVAGGQIAFGLTDTDDAIIEIERGRPVAIVYPDREPDQLGTLFIPNTLAIMKGCPHPEAARKLVDYLLSVEVEKKLAAGPSAQIPLGGDPSIQPRVETPETVHAMEVDFAAAARAWDEAAAYLQAEFLPR